jgi:hypothetical protein
MDGRKNPRSPDKLRAGIDADAAPIVMDVRRSANPHDKSAATIRNRIELPPADDSSIVFCGSEREVREGFAVALRAMGIAPDVIQGVAAPVISQEGQEGKDS